VLAHRRDEATHHNESKHRVGRTPAVAIDQILGPWHQHQRAYAGAAEHQAGGETTALAEPQCHLRQVGDETNQIQTLGHQHTPGEIQMPGGVCLGRGDQAETQTQSTAWKQPAWPVTVEQAAGEPGQSRIAYKGYGKG
jgi:hypothetical protein